MTASDLKTSWAITLRHLAASRFYLPADLASAEAQASWATMQNYLHHNELGLALEEAMDLGEACSPPQEYWHELLHAADNMGLQEHSASIRARL
jgi:hypothetical protein